MENNEIMNGYEAEYEDVAPLEVAEETTRTSPVAAFALGAGAVIAGGFICKKLIKPLVNKIRGKKKSKEVIEDVEYVEVEEVASED